MGISLPISKRYPFVEPKSDEAENVSQVSTFENTPAQKPTVRNLKMIMCWNYPHPVF